MVKKAMFCWCKLQLKVFIGHRSSSKAKSEVWLTMDWKQKCLKRYKDAWPGMAWSFIPFYLHIFDEVMDYILKSWQEGKKGNIYS